MALVPRVVLGVALATIAAATVAGEGPSAPAPTVREKEVLQRMIELEDRARAFRQKADELQRQAENLARGLVGRKAVDPKAAMMAPGMQTLRRLIAPEGPRGKAQRQGSRDSTKKVKRLVGEAYESPPTKTKAHDARLASADEKYRTLLAECSKLQLPDRPDHRESAVRWKV